jgi:hypothetical protein
MERTAFIALASVMLVILSSFRSSVQPEQALITQTESFAIIGIQKPPKTDCMKAELAYSEALCAYLETENYVEMGIQAVLMGYSFNEWLNCI